MLSVADELQIALLIGVYYGSNIYFLPFFLLLVSDLAASLT